MTNRFLKLIKKRITQLFCRQLLAVKRRRIVCLFSLVFKPVHFYVLQRVCECAEFERVLLLKFYDPNKQKKKKKLLKGQATNQCTAGGHST